MASPAESEAEDCIVLVFLSILDNIIALVLTGWPPLWIKGTSSTPSALEALGGAGEERK